MRVEFPRIALVTLCAGIVGCAQQTIHPTSPDASTPIGAVRTQSGAADFSLPAGLSLAEDPVSTLVRPQISNDLSVTIDPQRIYTLPELIDIAQRNKPATRAAWLRAREAALAVDVVEATYLPQLSANVLAGFATTSQFESAIPELGIGTGRLTATGHQVVPNLAVEWLLFDFGTRDAALEIAKQASIGSNIAFHGVHQRVIFEVSEAYFQLSAARAETHIVRERLEDAHTLRRIAEGRLKEGLAIRVEVAQARQLEAQAQFDLTLAESREDKTRAALMHAMGLSPTTSIQVADLADRRLPKEVPMPLDELIGASLAQRPDIQAALTQVRAARSEVDLVASASRPKIAAVAQVGRAIGGFSLHDSRFGERASMNRSLDEAMAGIVFTMPLFDGGRRQTRHAQARMQAEAAEQDLLEIRNLAAQEIVDAYSLLHSSLAAYTASGPLLEAGRETYETALGLYENGLASMAEVSQSKIALNDARLLQAQAFADTFAAATGLAFATGRLTSRDVPARL